MNQTLYYRKLVNTYLKFLLSAVMVFLRDKYAVIRLNIPTIGGNKKPLGGNKKQVCELYHDWLYKKSCKDGNKLLLRPLFKQFSLGKGGKNREPISDKYRHHCEGYLKKIQYEASQDLPQILKSPPPCKKQLEHIIERAKDIGKMIGGEDMNLIYDSLLVSEPGGGNQSWHEDVLEEQSKGNAVFAMIVSMHDDTVVDIQTIDGKTIAVPILSGYVMIFDAKTLVHRGVGYKNWNARFYLKFSKHELRETESGEAEVVPLPTCRDCKMDVTDLHEHHKVCNPYIMKIMGWTAKHTTEFLEKSEKRQNKKWIKYNKGKRKEMAKLKQEDIGCKSKVTKKPLKKTKK